MLLDMQVTTGELFEYNKKKTFPERLMTGRTYTGKGIGVAVLDTGLFPMQTLTAVSVFFMISFFTTDSHMMIMDMEPMLPGSWQEMAECPLAGIQVQHLAAALLL
ncbi:MAG: hypothetical protein ACLR5B_06790 [Blautia sp.]